MAINIGSRLMGSSEDEDQNPYLKLIRTRVGEDAPAEAAGPVQPVNVQPANPPSDQMQAPQAPVYDKAGEQAIRADIDKYSQPIDRNQITPEGKSKYKMGIGQRILGGVSDALLGFSGQKGTVYIGPGATNHQYKVDEQDRINNLPGAQTRFNAFKTANEEEDKSFDRQNKAFANEALVNERNAKANKYDYQSMSPAERVKMLPQVEQELGSPLNEEQRNEFVYNGKLSPPKKSDKQTKLDDTEDRATLADKYGLKGNERRRFILTGKMDKEGTDRQPTELETWMAAFKRDNGRPPTAQEIADRKYHAPQGKGESNSSTFKDSAAIDKYSNEWYLKQRGDVERAKNQALRLAGNDPEKAQEQYKQIEDEYQKRANEFEQQKKGYYDQLGKSGTTQPQNKGGETSPATQPSPQTHVFDVQAWKSKNPKGDAKAAAKYAQEQGYRVINGQ